MLTIREVSAALFVSERFAEIVVALDKIGATHAQGLAVHLGMAQPRARAALLRLLEAGLLTELPREGSRAPRVFEVDDVSRTWRRLVDLSRAVVGEPSSETR